MMTKTEWSIVSVLYIVAVLVVVHVVGKLVARADRKRYRQRVRKDGEGA